MKNIIKYVACAMAAGALLVGCAADPNEMGPVKSGNNTITFSMPFTNQGTVTYAVGAEQGEADLNHLTIYMFDDATQKLEWVFENVGATKNVDDYSATIDVTEREGKKVFFFVGNGDAISSQLKAARFGETTVAQFQDMISDRQTALPVSPLLMTAKTEIADITDVQDAEKEVELKRRVARFDINNDEKTGPDATNFKIKEILIARVNQQGYFFDNDTRTDAAMASGNIPSMTFGDKPGHNEGITKAVFYTYPTTLAAGKTEISFVGDFAGQERIYSLVPTTDFEIKANSRYTLKAKKITPVQIDFEISVDEWGEGVEMESQPNKNDVEMISLQVKTGDGVLDTDAMTLDMTGKNETVLKFTAKSFRKDGTKIDITYIHGDQAILPIEVNTPQAILTYNAHYEQAYEITFKKQTIMAPAEVMVELVSVNDPRERVKITATATPNYNAVGKPLMVGGVWWAPANVGATTVTGATASGSFYQWGRNAAFPATGVVQTFEGPIEANQSDGVGNIFITAARSSYTYDWVDVQNDRMWKDSPSPCPLGWRLPTAAEFQIVVDIFNNESSRVAFTANGMEIKDDDDDATMYLPFAGYRDVWTGDVIQAGSRVLYWSSDPTDFYSMALNIYKTKPANGEQTNVSRHWRANGFQIRCVANK